MTDARRSAEATANGPDGHAWTCPVRSANYCNCHMSHAEGGDRPAEATPVWHFMPSPGVAACGADYANMCKTAIRIDVTCPACHRQMLGPDKATVRCPQCNGSGLGPLAVYGRGDMTSATADQCAFCMGRGKVVLRPSEARDPSCTCMFDPIVLGHAEECPAYPRTVQLNYACVNCSTPVLSHSMHCSTCLRAFNAGVERAQRRERAIPEERGRIVAWLRGWANEKHPIEAGEVLFSPAGRGLILMAATAIENGEHEEESPSSGQGEGR